MLQASRFKKQVSLSAPKIEGGKVVRPLFASVEELLEPDTLSTLGNVAVKNVRRVPVEQADAYSGSRFHSIETNDQLGPRFILKLPPQDADAPASWGGLNRTVAAWQHGIFDNLPPTIEHATLACAHDGAGYAILMQDVGDMLVRRDRQFTVAEHELFLDAMVMMHNAFWEDAQFKTSLSPSPYFLIDPTAEGWDVVEDFLEPDVAQVTRSLLQNAQPLYDAFAHYPKTLVHNDLWYANLGISRGEPPHVVMLDWDFATLAPPAVDLVFYIGENAGVLPSDDDVSIAEAYRSRLARRLGERFDAQQWLPQLELCLLGDFMRRGKWTLLEAARAPDKEKRAQVQKRLVRCSVALGIREKRQVPQRNHVAPLVALGKNRHRRHSVCTDLVKQFA